MSIIKIKDLKDLLDDYLHEELPAGQKNVSTACFNLQDVKDLIADLPSEAAFIKIVLVLENTPLPASNTPKRVSMGMVGADGDGAKIIYDSYALLADRACPPDCSSPDEVRARRIS